MKQLSKGAYDAFVNLEIDGITVKTKDGIVKIDRTRSGILRVVCEDGIFFYDSLQQASHMLYSAGIQLPE